MKTNVIAAALFLGVAIGPVSAQSVSGNGVPESVKNAFAGKYATAKGVKWDKEGGAWEASFELNGEKKSAVFTSSGKQTEMEMEIPVAKLPEAVRRYMREHKKSVVEAAEITDPSGKKYYEAEAGGKDYLFTAEGKPVQKIGQ